MTAMRVEDERYFGRQSVNESGIVSVEIELVPFA